MDVGVYAEMTGDHPAGLRALDALLGWPVPTTCPHTATLALNNSCEIGLDLGDFAQVIAWAEEGMRLAEAAEDIDAFAGLISQRGLARLETGDLDGAGGDLRTGPGVARAGRVHSLAGLDAVATRSPPGTPARDRPRTAAVLLGAFEAGMAALELAEQPLVRQIRERHLANLPTQLGWRVRRGVGGGPRSLYHAPEPAGARGGVEDVERPRHSRRSRGNGRGAAAYLTCADLRARAAKFARCTH